MKQEISILGCGWLGFPLAVSLVNKGYAIKGSTTSVSKLENLKSEGIIPFLIDLNNLDNNIQQFLSSEILIISVTSKNIDFKKLIQEIEKSEIKKVLFISSISVYNNTNQVVTEETPTNNSELNKIEDLFKLNNTFQTTIIRFGGLFGYDRKPGNFFPQNKIVENPEGFINFIHRNDCVRIIELVVSKNIWNEILNACAESHPTRRNFFTNENLKLGKEIPLFNEHSTNEYKIISVEKLKSMLDFNFEYSDLMNIK